MEQLISHSDGPGILEEDERIKPIRLMLLRCGFWLFRLCRPTGRLQKVIRKMQDIAVEQTKCVKISK